MTARLPLSAEPWCENVALQDGVVSRQQLLSSGLTPGWLRSQIDGGRWRILLPGVYATFTGPVSATAQVWAAVLYAGTDAAASHRTALWLGGLFADGIDPVHVSVPASRRVQAQPGVRIHLSRPLDERGRLLLHPSASPPRIRLEAALLDHCDQETAERTTHLILSAVQQRLTTADRIRTWLNGRPRHRWRHLIRELLAEAREGVSSPLELQFRRRVERGHALPVGLRNLAETSPTGGTWYRDVRYPRWRVIVELDGRAAHPPEQAFRDLRRDNLAAIAGDTVLRYGWRDVVGEACSVADQVAVVLHARGWRGQPRRCGANCSLTGTT